MEVQNTTAINSQDSSQLTTEKPVPKIEADTEAFDSILLKALDLMLGTSSSKENIADAAQDSASDTSETDSAEDQNSGTDSAGDVSDSAAEDFALSMIQSLINSTMVNEEQLYRTLIEQKLKEINPEAAAYYSEQVQQIIEQMRAEAPYVTEEEAAKAALRATVDAGLIDLPTAEKVNAEAFAAAQLDDNTEELYDSMGSGDDPTVAVADIKTAFAKAKTALESIAKGELVLEGRPLDEPADLGFAWGPNGYEGTTDSGEISGGGAAASGTQQMDGDGGFLWKPVSEADGNLAVLLPSDFTGNIDRVELHEPGEISETSLIDAGRYAGVRAEDGRAIFRFEQPGGAYPGGTQVVAYFDSGESAVWEIQDTGARND